MSTILLTTLNARYFHTSLALRYLYANLRELQPLTRIREFIISQRPLDIAEALLAEHPTIIGFGVYLWNVVETTQVITILKQVRPELILVLGGPEVSHEWDEQPITQWADYIISGPGDLAFAQLCRHLLSGTPPIDKIIVANPPPLDQITLPYRHYEAEDLAHRLIYVESSRGCPFRCTFCLSARDQTVWSFPLKPFLAELEHLYQRGARHFKFVDRTFNLNIQRSVEILDFFLERLDEHLFLHFELIPDHLPEELKKRIQRFPPGSLQFEIGIQTFNPDVQALIQRRQDNYRAEANLHWLRTHTHAHLHADLIIGLPNETLDSFAAGFDRLIALNPQEIQVGILKRLRGTPITQYIAQYDCRFNPYPPYNLLCSAQLDFPTMRRLERFARYWDLIGNSGRFVHTRPLLLGGNPFARFLTFSDWLFKATGQTHQIAQERLFDLVYRGLIEALNTEEPLARNALSQDFHNSGIKGHPPFLRDQRQEKSQLSSSRSTKSSRQARHWHREDFC